MELQFGHSSLARQFMSPLTNYRSDEYGGELENRLRFPLELIDAVRKAVGADFTLGVRLCADELIPGGLTLEDTKGIAERLQATGQLDFFNLTLATFYNLYLVGGPMHMPLGYAVPLAAGIKEVSTLPVFATGRINDPAMAERVLAEGQADMIGVVRGQIADPDFVAQGQGGADRGDPLLHRLQPELLRAGRPQQDHRLRAEPVGGLRGHRGGTPPAAGAAQEAGHGRRRRPGGHVGGQDRDPPRARGHALREG